MYQYLLSNLFQIAGGYNIEPVKLPQGRLRLWILIGAIIVLALFGLLFYKIFHVFNIVNSSHSVPIE